MDLAIIGKGEIATELYSLINTCCERDKYEKIYFVDLIEDAENNVIAEEKYLETDTKSSQILIAMAEPFARMRILKKYAEKGFELTKFIHPWALISDDVFIEDGVIVFPFSYVANNARIGKNTMLHAGSKIENDCIICDNCFVGGNSYIGSRTVVESSCFVGPGAIVRDGLNIGKESIIGMGAVVTKSIEDGSVCYGTPAIKVAENVLKRVFK